MKRLTSLSLLTFALACSSTSSDEPDQTVQDVHDVRNEPADLADDLANDVASEDEMDIATDTGPADPCQDPHFGPIDLFPGGPTMQIHASTAFDGTGAWVAFNLPDEDGGFDVWATRVGCDGQHLVDPMRLHESPTYSQTDPAVAVNGDRVLVTWQQDTKNFPDNLSVYYRLLTVDGELLGDGPTELPTLAPDTPESANAWMPAATAVDDGFIIAAAAAVEGATGWQITGTRIGADGSVGESIGVPGFEAEASQIYPTVAHANGDTFFAWTRTEIDADDRAQLVQVDAAGTPQTVVELLAGDTSASPWVNAAGAKVFTAFDAPDGNTRKILVTTLEAGAPAATCTLGEEGSVSHTPAVTAPVDAPVVVWYENQSGLKNVLYLQSCTSGDSPAPSGSPFKVNDAYAAPYAPALTTVNETVVFAAWSEGLNPDYMAKGRFIKLSL